MVRWRWTSRGRWATPYERFLAGLECFDHLDRTDVAQLARVVEDVSLPAGTSLEVAPGERCVLAGGVLAGVQGVVSEGRQIPPGTHFALGMVRVLLLPCSGGTRGARTKVIWIRSHHPAEPRPGGIARSSRSRV
jgi:hypothetical protein